MVLLFNRYSYLKKNVKYIQEYIAKLSITDSASVRKFFINSKLYTLQKNLTGVHLWGTFASHWRQVTRVGYSQCTYGCPKLEFSSLGHPNMAEASLGKNFPKVIPSLLHIFSGWYLQGLVIWCVSLSRPQNFLCKRRHIARPGDYISLGDARISTGGCPNLPRLNKPGCPKLRQDARICVKMPESRLTIRCRDRWLNNYCFISDGEDDYICCESNAQWYS